MTHSFIHVRWAFWVNYCATYAKNQSSHVSLLRSNPGKVLLKPVNIDHFPPVFKSLPYVQKHVATKKLFVLWVRNGMVFSKTPPPRVNPRESGKNQPKDVARLVCKMSRNAITITHMNGGAHRRARIVPVLNDSPTKEEVIQIALLHRPGFTCGRTPNLLSDRAMKARARLQRKLAAKKAEK